MKDLNYGRIKWNGLSYGGINQTKTFTIRVEPNKSRTFMMVEPNKSRTLTIEEQNKSTNQGPELW